MNILVLGAGLFGTAIANELSVNKNNNVIIFSRDKKKVHEINSLHTNKVFFPNKPLLEELKATSDKHDIQNADIIFIALPSSVIVDELVKLKEFFRKDVLLVNLSKGLLSGGLTIVDSIKESLNIDNVVTLKGPSFAIEIMEHANTLLTLGYTEKHQYELIMNVIKNTSLHIDYTKDIMGVEVLSVIKNIYALVIGVVDARYNSPNTRFMILTKAFSEIRELLSVLGGREETLFLACGFGDLCLTSLNDLSRNRTLGLLIGKGFFNSDYKANTVILEGLQSIEICSRLLNKRQLLSLPIFHRTFEFFSRKETKFDINFRSLIN